MIDYYFVTIFLGIFMMLIMKVMIVNNVLLEKEKKKTLDTIAMVVILASLCEWMGVLLDGGDAATIGLHKFVKVAELSLAPVIPILCADVIGKVRHKKLAAYILMGQALLEILSAWTGKIFFVDAQNVYHHGEFYEIYTAAFLLGIIYFTAAALAASRRQYGVRRALFILLPVFLLLGIAFQYFGNQIRIIWLCVAINVMLMYIIYLEQTLSVDGLTHLQNRLYYEKSLGRISGEAVIFFFDVNNFKSINDTYGHAYGDYCLMTAAALIQDTFGKRGVCYRIGGDEFCAILPIAYEKAERYIRIFKNRLAEKQKTDDKLPGVAVGYGFFQAGRNTVSQAIEAADEMMYHEKRKEKGL